MCQDINGRTDIRKKLLTREQLFDKIQISNRCSELPDPGTKTYIASEDRIKIPIFTEKAERQTGLTMEGIIRESIIRENVENPDNISKTGRTYNLMKNDRICRIKKHRRIKGQRRAKRLAARFITVLSLLLILLTLLGSICSFADSSSSDSIKEKHYSSIMIYPGDSIDSLTEKYLCPEQNDRERLKNEIASINHLSAESALTAGNHIIVPVYE